jgi:hypothetical protein
MVEDDFIFIFPFQVSEEHSSSSPPHNGWQHELDLSPSKKTMLCSIPSPHFVFRMAGCFPDECIFAFARMSARIIEGEYRDVAWERLVEDIDGFLCLYHHLFGIPPSVITPYLIIPLHMIHLFVTMYRVQPHIPVSCLCANGRKMDRDLCSRHLLRIIPLLLFRVGDNEGELAAIGLGIRLNAPSFLFEFMAVLRLFFMVNAVKVLADLDTMQPAMRCAQKLRHHNALALRLGLRPLRPGFLPAKRRAVGCIEGAFIVDDQAAASGPVMF